MASEDRPLVEKEEIDNDVTKEPELPLQWHSQHHCSDARSWSERSVKSPTTPRETDCWNPSAAAMKCEPDSQPVTCQGIKAEPVDDRESETSQVFDQVQSVDSREELDFKCEFSYEPGSSADLSSSPAGPWGDVKREDSQSTFVHMSTEENGRPQLADDPRSSPHESANNTSDAARQSQNTSYKCHICSAAFVLLNSFKQHVASVHGHKVQDVLLPLLSTQAEGCDVGHCGNIDIEKIAHGDSKTAETEKDQADSKEADGADLMKDRMRHVCDVCCKAFKKASILKRHKLIHTGPKQFVCDVCSKAFTHANILKRHKLIHDGQKQFVCEVCKKAFHLACHLKRHKLIHSGDKHFVCDVCNWAFTEAGNLKKHMLNHTGPKQFVCDVCSKAFTQARTLKTHKLVHSGHKQFVCDVCNKAFTRVHDLKKHVMIHSGHKQFSCDVCNKAFTRAGSVTRHKLIHSAHKPFVCDICDKVFTEAVDLGNHKLIHAGCKQFVCDVCYKVFNLAQNLKAHKLIHTGLKPFVCDVCSKAFTQAGTLKRHRRIHIEERAESYQVFTL